MYIMYIFLCKYVCIAVVCLFGGWLLRPRKYGGGGHASLAGRDLPPAPVCTPLKQPRRNIREADRICDTQGSAHAAVYIRLTREAV